MSLEGHTSAVMSAAICVDGKRLASASHDQSVKLWDASSGQETLTLKGHIGQVWCVVFSPDGKLFASASYDQTLRVWDVTSGQETLTLKEHSDPVCSVVFSADGMRLASASGDETVKVWDARPWTLKLRAECEALSLIHWLRGQAKAQTEWLNAIAADQDHFGASPRTRPAIR